MNQLDETTLSIIKQGFDKEEDIHFFVDETGDIEVRVNSYFNPSPGYIYLAEIGMTYSLSKAAKQTYIRLLKKWRYEETTIYHRATNSSFSLDAEIF